MKTFLGEAFSTTITLKRDLSFSRGFLSLTKRSKVHREFKLDRNCKSVLNISLAAFEKVVSYSFNVYFELVAG